MGGAAGRLRTVRRRLHDAGVWPSRRLARVTLVGGGIGGIGVPALVVAGGWTPATASRVTFALGALVLGFAVLSWAGAVAFGPAIETLQRHFGRRSGWTEAGARLAFSTLSAFGAGVMLGSVVGTVAVG